MPFKLSIFLCFFLPMLCLSSLIPLLTPPSISFSCLLSRRQNHYRIIFNYACIFNNSLLTSVSTLFLPFLMLCLSFCIPLQTPFIISPVCFLVAKITIVLFFILHIYLTIPFLLLYPVCIFHISYSVCPFVSLC